MIAGSPALLERPKRAFGTAQDDFCLLILGDRVSNSAFCFVNPPEDEMSTGKAGVRIERLGCVFHGLSVIAKPEAEFRGFRAHE